jgi:hypothetical protein
VEIEQALDEEELRFFIEFRHSPLSGRSTNQLNGRLRVTAKER